MLTAIQSYKEKAKAAGLTAYDFPGGNTKDIDPELTAQFSRGELFIPKNTRFSYPAFEREFGFPLPRAIRDYFNFFWQTGIFGYLPELRECVMLFDVLRLKCESSGEHIFHKYGFMHCAREWYDDGGDIAHFIPIGQYDAMALLFVLFETGTGRIFIQDYDEYDRPSPEPIAQSLSELISRLSIRPEEKHYGLI